MFKVYLRPQPNFSHVSSRGLQMPVVHLDRIFDLNGRMPRLWVKTFDIAYSIEKAFSCVIFYNESISKILNESVLPNYQEQHKANFADGSWKDENMIEESYLTFSVPDIDYYQLIAGCGQLIESHFSIYCYLNKSFDHSIRMIKICRQLVTNFDERALIQCFMDEVHQLLLDQKQIWNERKNLSKSVRARNRHVHESMLAHPHVRDDAEGLVFSISFDGHTFGQPTEENWNTVEELREMLPLIRNMTISMFAKCHDLAKKYEFDRLEAKYAHLRKPSQPTPGMIMSFDMTSYSTAAIFPPR